MSQKMRLTMQMVKGQLVTEEMLEALTGGNALAIEGLRAIVEYAPAVDPEYSRLQVAYLFLIDSLRIWDNDLAILWKDVCGKHAGRMIALLRSCQSRDIAAVERAEQMLHEIIRKWPNGPYVDFAQLEQLMKLSSPRFNIEGTP